jgi:hypothetical protein
MEGTFGDLVKARNDLAAALGQNDIGVNLANGAFLNIRVVNSPLNELSATEKNAKALEIARRAYRSYPSRSALLAVSVEFGIHRSYVGIFSYDGSAGAYRFHATELEAAASAPSAIP